MRNREKIPDWLIGYVEAQRIAARSTEIPRPDGTVNQATAYPGNRGGFWSTEAEEVHEVDFWTLEDPRGLAPSSHFWNEGASSPYIRSFMHDGVICVIR